MGKESYGARSSGGGGVLQGEEPDEGVLLGHSSAEEGWLQTQTLGQLLEWKGLDQAVGKAPQARRPCAHVCPALLLVPGSQRGILSPAPYLSI